MRTILLATSLMFGTAGVYRASTFRPMFNFHAVEDGRLYRSAQPRAEEIDQLVRDYGIKTIINLRGTQLDQDWYVEERAAADRLNVRMEDIGFSSGDWQSRESWKEYLDLLHTAERPILVHCRAGADRTGEASAIYVMEYMAGSMEQALEQLSINYLHVELFKPNKRAFVRAYHGEDWLRDLYVPEAAVN